MRATLSIVVLITASSALAGAAGLKQQAEAYAEQPVVLDPRLSVPACQDGIVVGWRSDARTSLVARCAATGWALVIPVAVSRGAGQARAPVLVRRGEPVQVASGGNGFRVVANGIAERDGRAGERIVVRNAASGRRLAVDIGADGGMALAAIGDGGQGRP